MSELVPKVFISYSRSFQEQKDRVREWANRLLEDGIEVVFDQYDLTEGDDKIAFMEKMVTDESVTHVLAFCDKEYSEKANSRRAGVGTESQIISVKIYKKVEQTKFIPVACEFDDKGDPYLPTFFESRIYINFSTPEFVNNNWEGLVRLLFDKPIHQKPALGKPPGYIADNSAQHSISASFKFPMLEQAIIQGKSQVSIYRSDFLDACIDFADSLRIREQPNPDTFVDNIVGDFGKLKPVRDLLVDWALLEARARPNEKFPDELVAFLERLRELKSRPSEVTRHSEDWFAAHTVFVYETFLYIIAALLKAEAFETLHEIFETHYLIPEVERYGNKEFDKFGCFWGHTQILAKNLIVEGRRFLSPEAELIKRQADRCDIPFMSVIEADVLVYLMALLSQDTDSEAYWYPGTLHYAPYMHKFPFFLKATRHKGFRKLAIITGIDSAEQLKEAVYNAQEHHATIQWNKFRFQGNISNMINLDKLDTLT